jgi:hypothetical protein
MSDVKIPITSKSGKVHSISDVLLKYVVECDYKSKPKIQRAISSLFILSCGIAPKKGIL